jgi:TRAP-type mannitol/chloroaromatic compound transport system permease small subunit
LAAKPQFVQRLDALIAHADWLAQRAAWAGGGLILASALLVTADVASRKLLSVPIGNADELSGYAFAIGCAWAFAFALLRRVNVRVDVVYARLPVRLCAVLDVLALVALGVFVALLSRYAFEVAQQSWQRGALSNTQLKVPLWIPQSLWAAGLALFMATLALMLLRAATALVTGDWQAVQSLFGARSIQEDADEEAAYAKDLSHKAGAP